MIEIEFRSLANSKFQVSTILVRSLFRTEVDA